MLLDILANNPFDIQAHSSRYSQQLLVRHKIFLLELVHLRLVSLYQRLQSILLELLRCFNTLDLAVQPLNLFGVAMQDHVFVFGDFGFQSVDFLLKLLNVEISLVYFVLEIFRLVVGRRDLIL